MKTPPCAMPKTFTPISVRGVPRYLKYMPISSPTQRDGLGQRDRSGTSPRRCGGQKCSS